MDEVILDEEKGIKNIVLKPVEKDYRFFLIGFEDGTA
jgi:hypothetical protein